MSKERTILSLSATSLEAAFLCLRKYHYQQGRGLIHQVKPDSLVIGDFVHYILEQFYNAKKEGLKPDVDAIVEAARYYAATESDITSHDCERVIKRFIQYAIYYAVENWEILAVEQSYAVPIIETSDLVILLEGRLDLIIDIPSIGRVIVDHKSGASYHEPNKLHLQAQIYSYVTGIDKVLINFFGMQETYKPKDAFKRKYLPFNKEDWDELEGDLIYAAKTIIAHDQAKFYPRNFTSCDKFGGCQFREVCSTTKDTREWKLTTLFKVRQRSMLLVPQVTLSESAELHDRIQNSDPNLDETETS